jgi:hypothetical protein
MLVKFSFDHYFYLNLKHLVSKYVAIIRWYRIIIVYCWWPKQMWSHDREAVQLIFNHALVLNGKENLTLLTIFAGEPLLQVENIGICLVFKGLSRDLICLLPVPIYLEKLIVFVRNRIF